MPRPAVDPPLPDRAIRDEAYQQALAYLYGFSPLARSAPDILQDRPRKLPRMRDLLARLGNPHQRFSSVLVAGTKGKGSTAAMLDSMARAAGHSTGLYAQPHLHSWRERTRLSGRLIEPGEVVELTRVVRSAVEALERERPDLGPPTTFEVGTGLTFAAFARHGLRLAVVEVGVGGSHDATNVVEPSLVALGPISYDHMATLGSTLAEIAVEKAGLFRRNGLALVGFQPSEALATVERIACERGTRLEVLGREWRWSGDDDRPACGRFTVNGPGVRFDHLAIPLLGRHQRDNATLAVAAAHALGECGFSISSDAVRRGLAEVVWPGRLQLLRRRPWLLVDGAHNRDSALRLVEALRECFAYRRLHLVLGMTEGNDLDGVLEALLPAADSLVVSRSEHYRACPLDVLATAARSYGAEPRIEAEVGKAVGLALTRADSDDLVCVTGSLFLVAEAIEATSGMRDEE